MKKLIALLPLALLAACQSPVGAPPSQANADACGASKFQHLVGGPASAVSKLNIPDDSRHYGRKEMIDPRKVPTRLNFIVSTDDVVESVTNPKATIVKVFCG